MKIIFIPLTAILLLTSCGTSDPNPALSENATPPTEVSAPRILKFENYVNLARGLDLGSITMKNETSEVDTALKTFNYSWNVDPNQSANFDMISLNGSIIGNDPKTQLFKHYSRELFENRKKEVWSNATVSHIGDYATQRGIGYICWLTDYGPPDNKINAVAFDYVDEKAEIVIEGLVIVYDTKIDLVNTETVVYKILDRLGEKKQ